MKDYYQVLQISVEASQDAIRRQYRQLAFGCHPDRQQDPKAKARAEERLKALNEAYETLSDPQRRARYDHQRTTGPAEPRRPRRTPTPASPTPNQQIFHHSFQAAFGQMAVVRLSHRARVLLLNPQQYQHYLNGQRYEYLGGVARRRIVMLPIPRTGRYHIVIEPLEQSPAFEAVVGLMRLPFL